MSQILAALLIGLGLTMGTAYAQDGSGTDSKAEGRSPECEKDNKECVAPLVDRPLTAEAPHRIQNKAKTLLDQGGEAKPDDSKGVR